MKIVAILGTSRENSNTKILKDRTLMGIEHQEIHLKDFHIEGITDQRHDQEGFVKKEDQYYEIMEAVLEADILVFVTPLYWYGMSGVMKNFIDRFSESLRDDRLGFKEKAKNQKAYLLVVGGDNPKLKGLPLIQQFKYIFSFLEMEFAGYLIGEGNYPNEITDDEATLRSADFINEQLRGEL